MIQLFNDDCFTIMEDLIKDKVVVDSIICDPPYNISYDEWDKDFDIKKAITLCKQLLKPNGNIIIFQGWSNVCKTKEILDNEFICQNWIIWDRIKGRGTTKNLVSTREDILWYSNGNSPTYNKIYSNIPKLTSGLGIKNGEENRALSNVWYDISPIVPWSDEKTDHPTQKPIELMNRIVTIWSNENDTILDFTMGSGTTGVSCKILNRNFIGIEINKDYYSIAEQRIKNTTTTNCGVVKKNNHNLLKYINNKQKD